MAVIKKRIVFLCSGDGGNLCFINDAIQQGWIKETEIVCVITDRSCQANQFAISANIPTHCIDFKKPGQPDLINILQEVEPDLIITTVHKIIEKSVINLFYGKLINLHYSLLPAFGGLIGANSVKAAMDFGAKFTGITVHYVDENLDGGKPIMQAAISLHENDELSDIMNLVFRCGCIALMATVKKLFNQTQIATASDIVTIKTRNCLFSEAISLCSPNLAAENYWESIKEKLAMEREYN